MVSLLADENLRSSILRALLQRMPEIDIVRVQDVGLMSASDSDVLKWAAERNRILVTHDRETVPFFAYERVQSGIPMPGVIVADDRIAAGRVAERIWRLIQDQDPVEFENRVFFVSGG
jgi:hypothetical protein